MSYMNDIPDHPVIRNMERTGYPDGKEPEYPHCPVCQEQECSEVYENNEYDIVGCEACVTKQAAEDLQAFLEKSGEDGIPVCPVCGQECEDAYTDRDGDILGCDQCISLTDAWQKPACFHEHD